MLAIFYENGIGVGINLEKAYIWANIAREYGEEPENLLSLQTELSSQQKIDTLLEISKCLRTALVDCIEL
jgi:TPR repeat protein